MQAGLTEFTVEVRATHLCNAEKEADWDLPIPFAGSLSRNRSSIVEPDRHMAQNWKSVHHNNDMRSLCGGDLHPGAFPRLQRQSSLQIVRINE